jgi:hypothetical protein
MMNLLKNVVWVVVVLTVGIFVLRMPAAAELRQLVLAETPMVAPTSVPTPTLVPATSTVVPTGTATTIPTATKTPMPTMTPTATRYVVQVSAVERNVKAANRQIVYETDIDVTVKYSDENKLPVWNGGQVFIMQATYHVMASFDWEMMKTNVNPTTGQITVTLPAPRLEPPALIGRPTYDYYKSGIKYYFNESDQVEWTQRSQVDAQAKASQRACEIGLLAKAATQAKYVVKDLILNISPLINSRDITVIVPAGTCDK